MSVYETRIQLRSGQTSSTTSIDLSRIKEELENHSKMIRTLSKVLQVGFSVLLLVLILGIVLNHTLVKESKSQDTDKKYQYDCALDYIHYLDKYYKYSYPLASTWENSREICQSWASNGELASIHDNKTNNFLSGLLKDDSVWIGANDESDIKMWSDGSVWDFENWHSGQPDDKDYDEIVIDMKGQWWDRDGNNMYSFICQCNP